MPLLYVVSVPSDKRKPNKVIQLDVLTKKKILHELLQVATYPENTVLALAEEIPEDYQIQARDMYTTQDYLEIRGTTLNRSQLHKFANLVTRYYKEKYQGQSPRIITRPDDRGRWLIKLNGYQHDDLPLLDKALDETLGIDKEQ